MRRALGVMVGKVASARGRFHVAVQQALSVPLR
jgi:hypothetical protein